MALPVSYVDHMELFREKIDAHKILLRGKFEVIKLGKPMFGPFENIKNYSSRINSSVRIS